jgi:hypothetical protein
MKATTPQPAAYLFKLNLALLAASFMSGCGEKYALDKQMEALCKKDGGIKIYETVTLPKNQMDQHGTPIGTYSLERLPNKDQLPDDYQYHIVANSEYVAGGDTTNTLKGEGKLAKFKYQVYRRSDGKLLGENITYGRSGGDGVLLFGHPSSTSCPDKNLNQILFTKIFIKGE